MINLYCFKKTHYWLLFDWHLQFLMNRNVLFCIWSVYTVGIHISWRQIFGCFSLRRIFLGNRFFIHVHCFVSFNRNSAFQIRTACSLHKTCLTIILLHLTGGINSTIPHLIQYKINVCQLNFTHFARVRPSFTPESHERFNLEVSGELRATE